MINNNAKKVKLADAASIKAGYPIRGRVEHVPGSGVRAVRLKDANLQDGIDWDSCIETELTGRVTPQWLEAKDVLFAAHGSHNTATYIKESFKGSEFKAVATPMFFVLRVLDKALLPEYLAWFINASPSQRYFEKTAEGTRTKSVRRQVLEELEIAIPPIEKQKTIVALANNVRQQGKYLKLLQQANEKMLNSIAQGLCSQEKKS